MEHVVSGQQYAMKVQDKLSILKNKCLPQVMNELFILRQIDSPFLVQLVESFQTESKLILILEYCVCGNFSRLLKKQEKNKMEESEARKYICEVLLAIEYLHRRNILYRDLKPDNILVDKAGHIKLADFGLSKALRSDSELSDTFCGSHAYLTPEMLERKPHGKSIDWYGVGALLYEMVVSIPPYLCVDQDKLYEQILKAPLKMPEFLSADCQSLIR